MKKNIDIKIFLIILLIFSLIVLVKLFKNSNDYNLTDNRTSYKFESPKIETIISGDFQQSVEDAIADQMPKYDWFKLVYSKVANFLNLETVYALHLDKYGRYVKLGGVYLYKGYLLYNNTTSEKFISTAKEDVDAINNIVDESDADFYLYFIETDSNINFETNYKAKATEYLKDNLNIDESHISAYNIDSFDDYKNYFYKTDHHWNYKGANKGYLEIAELMHFDNVLEIQDKICFKDAASSGSKTKSIGDNKYFKDTMCVYTYDYPDYEIIASGKKIKEYGSTLDELKKKDTLSYGAIYGGDYDEIIFKNKDVNNGKKLLLYANSFSNAINKLLAANYEETYVIDGRHYKDFNMSDYIEENEIDDVLILANCMLFWDDIEW